MSEQSYVSPLLDGLILGEPISDHHGVRCCPAIGEGTDEHYIVKIISIPATQVQVDALLLTGACTDQTQALGYFKELSDGVIGEIDILKKLNQLEGFVPYQAYQVRQMTDGIGYEVYLLNAFRRSLDTLMTDQPLTHLAAVNLGLDLCAALTACRRAGYLYIDLKPQNIFLSDTHGYQIGDLGFISLSSLKYASLPEKYRSSYTAPEITDAMSELTDTMDIYALGLILYQVYNNAQLPFDGEAPSAELPAPMYADYEMAEIILKACAPDPKDRWQDPAQMGQALVNYMQRNGVNDTPIIPPPVILEEPEEEVEDFVSEEENDEEFAALLAMIPDEVPPQQLVMDDVTVNEDETGDEEPEASVTDEENEPSETDGNQLSFLDEDGQLIEADVTEEVAHMLAQADELIAHELPEPVVAPAPIDVPIPAPIVEEPEPEIEAEETLSPAPAETEPDTEETEPEEITAEAIPEKPKSKRSYRGWIAAAIVLVLLIGAGIGGYFWYSEYYLQTIDAIQISGSVDTILVDVLTNTDHEMLTVVCTDTYGNTFRCPVIDGKAQFSKLNPATQYRIRLEISGLHKLEGQISGSYTTGAITEILDFSAVCGPADCSVNLFLSVKGTDDGKWNVVYSAPGEPEKTVTLTNQTATVFDLKENAEYTFRLMADDGVYLSGPTEATYTARKILVAKDPKITACGGGTMTVQWQAPDAPSGQKWLVRCYNDTGYDKTLIVSDTVCEFTELDHATGYQVLITAEGMNQSAETSVTANPVTVTGFTTNVTKPWAMTLSWEFAGNAPAGGWKVIYSMNGSSPLELICPENHADFILAPGANYVFTVTSADGTSCFAEDFHYGPVEIPSFDGYGLSSETIELSMVLRPNKNNWTYNDLADDDYRSEFTDGELASILLHATKTYDTSRANIVTTFVVRNSLGRPVSTESHSAQWINMWYRRYCELDLPAMPVEPDTYTVDIYFNDQYLGSLQFTVA